MVDFNQYYTSKNLSDLLSRFITLIEPRTCLELSAGEGALLDALKAKWEGIKCTTVDIDPTNHSLLQEKYPLDEHYCADATSEHCINILQDKKYDLAVCNPPFQTINTNEIINKHIKDAFEIEFKYQKKIRAEIIFLAINLLHVKTGGVLAIIVPELIIKGLKYNKFRKALFSNYKLQYLVESTHKAFKKTEAKTYILFLKKEKIDIIYKFTHIKVDSQAFLEKENIYDITNLYSLDDSVQKKCMPNHYEIIRGNISGKICKTLGLPYIHTTNMVENMSTIEFNENKLPSEYKTAAAGDIIISRVGTRVLGKTNIICLGNVILSDCVFAIRFTNIADKNRFLAYWKKNNDEWISTNATGTCAKHITKKSLIELIDTIISTK